MPTKKNTHTECTKYQYYHRFQGYVPQGPQQIRFCSLKKNYQTQLDTYSLINL